MGLMCSPRKKGAIRQGRNTTPGRDGLGYEIFKHMHDFALEWKHAVLVPILKPENEVGSPGSYRPTALTAVM